MRTAPLLALLLAFAACSQPQAHAPARNPRLDKLFAQLAIAPNPGEAAPIEQQIHNIWNDSGSPTVEILLERAQAAEAGGDGDLARAFLDRAAEIEPDFAEIYNRRAELAVQNNDIEGALFDINETLRREPRQFASLSRLGQIYEGMGQDRAALAAYRDALAIDPNFEAAKEGAAKLAVKVEGGGA